MLLNVISFAKADVILEIRYSRANRVSNFLGRASKLLDLGTLFRICWLQSWRFFKVIIFNLKDRHSFVFVILQPVNCIN